MDAQLIGSEEIEAYLEATQRLLPKLDLDLSDDAAQLQSLINEQADVWRGEELLERLLEGERAFYRGAFQESIEHYSAIKELPLSSFFCFRALGHLYADQGRAEEALSALDKALDLSPGDFVASQLAERLLGEVDEPLPLPEEPAPRPRSLADRVQRAVERRGDLIHQYVHASRLVADDRDASLLVLDGPQACGESPLPELAHPGSSGLFLRWEGKGIAINPGPAFLRRLHEAGGAIGQVDAVVVTRRSAVQPSDIAEFQRLSDLFNRMSGESHVIRYYLSEGARAELGDVLKPRYRGERDAIQTLSSYLDSAEVETVRLADGIELSYIVPCSRPTEEVLVRLNLTACGDFAPPSGALRRSIGYLSGGWCPEMATLFGGCDLLFSAIGQIDGDDCNKVHLSSVYLGYYGALTAAATLQPNAMLIGEFDEKLGDLRLDIVASLRGEMAGVAILPAESGLQLDLRTLQVWCAMSEQWADLSQVRVVPSREPFGQLHVLSPNCLL